MLTIRDKQITALAEAQPGHPVTAPCPPIYYAELRGDTVALQGVETKQVAYTKRSNAEWQALRNEFRAKVKGAFLQQISTDPEKITELKRAGLTDADIAGLREGNNPRDPMWQVHHKLPLDDNGTNDFDNLILMKNDPYHLAITNTQNTLTRGMQPGETRILDFPVPVGDSVVYPRMPEVR